VNGQRESRVWSKRVWSKRDSRVVKMRLVHDQSELVYGQSETIVWSKRDSCMVKAKNVYGQSETCVWSKRVWSKRVRSKRDSLSSKLDLYTVKARLVHRMVKARLVYG
jgi:hypothetical protein